VFFICSVLSVANGLHYADFAVIGLVHVFILAMLIYTLGGTSGGHFNPAVTAALAGSGFAGDRFVFLGFLPRKQSEMSAVFTELVDDRRTLVAYESPHRLLKALDTISATLPDRRVAVARELTKVHEEVRVAPAAELAGHYRDHPPRGEVTLVIEGAAKKKRSPA